MDAAKDIAFMTYLNMPNKKKEFEVKLKMYVNNFLNLNSYPYYIFDI